MQTALFCKYELLFNSIKRGLLTAVKTHRLNVNSRNLNNVGAVLGVEVVKIRSVLEVVCVDFAAVYNLVGLNVIGKFLNIKRYVFSSKNFLCYRKYFRVGCGRSRNGYCFACKRVVINGRIITVAGVFNNAYNRAAVFIRNKIRNLFAFKRSFKRLYRVGIFIALFNG